MRFSRKVEGEALEWYGRLVGGSLDEQEHEQLLAWLKKSETHQAAFVQMEQAWANGKQLNVINDDTASLFNVGNWICSLGTAVCITFLTGIFFFVSSNSSISTQELDISPGKIAVKTTTDGSEIILASNTQGQYKYDGILRSFELKSGTAYFDITSNSEEPFVVNTPQGSVKVLGTAFSVEVTPKETSVIVGEGHVALYSERYDQTKSKTSPLLTLSANQRLSIGDAQNGKEPKIVDASNALAWKDKRLIVKGETLERVTKQLNRFLGIQVNVLNQELKDYKIIGVVSLESPDDAVGAIASLTSSNLIKNSATSYSLSSR